MIDFREMSDESLRTLYEFAAPIWFECYKDVLEYGQIDFLTHKYFDFENIMQLKNDGMVYENIFENDKRVGFLAYKPNVNHVYLDKIYLLSNARGHHISSKAFSYLIKRFHLPIRLNVNQGNTLAVRAYLGNGFRIVEEKSYPLPGGYVNVDYIMEKSDI